MRATRKETELTDDEYVALLDEIYGEVEICGMTFSSGNALKELDRVAFDSSKSDYESAQDEDNPIWVCGECDEEHDDEEDAYYCCQKDDDEEEDDDETEGEQ